ncbi:MAG: RdgB/HAM1 family non-canonical purine NTP pyrophosphatase [Myxococcaceae bacterium]
MKVLFATNPGKLRELRELVGGELEWVSLSDLPPLPEVVEDQPTIEGNAKKKARAYASLMGVPALADDSGLFVEALGGRPGVQSARYGADDSDRIRRLLAELGGVANRKAAFRCALCLAMPGGEAVVEVGECPGEIVDEARGSHGFGYDPVFLIPAQGRTMAELTSAEKSALSHRGQAFKKMRPHLLALSKKSAV